VDHTELLVEVTDMQAGLKRRWNRK
jgi:hypothetical protein